jgi:hypothetical protein
MRYERRENKLKFELGKSQLHRMFNLTKKGIPASAYSKKKKRG